MKDDDLKKIFANLFKMEWEKTIKPSRLKELFENKKEGEHIEINVRKEAK